MRRPKLEPDRTGNVVPIQRTKRSVATRSQAVAQTLREAILNGEFSPGERLQEIPLSQWLSVSRTPIRSALQTLASSGMLEYSANRGYVVRHLGPAELLAIYEIRATLEGLACRFCAEHGLSSEDRARLEKAIEEGDRLFIGARFATRAREAYRTINVVIHETIVRCAGSRMLAEMIAMCHNIPTSSTHNIVWSNARAVMRRHDDHRRIFDAIVRREPDRAELLMREHVHCVRDELKARLDAAPAERA
jgi:GntR family transcriptional regulator of vanillate catabolism